ncbi:hypothetical protein BJX62DRAFT_243013 [Aspergillus germanicus]
MIIVCERSDGAHVDITLEDYRHLIDHLVTKWEPTALPEVGEIAAEAKASEAAASRGFPLEMVLKGFMQFKSLDFLPEDRRNLGPGSLSPLSQLVGMPISLWKLPMSGFRDTNVEAAYLNIDLDPARPSFWWAPPYWQTNVGQVVAVREDGKDLTKRDISMLCHCCAIMGRIACSRLLRRCLRVGLRRDRGLCRV